MNNENFKEVEMETKHPHHGSYPHYSEQPPNDFTDNSNADDFQYLDSSSSYNASHNDANTLFEEDKNLHDHAQTESDAQSYQDLPSQSNLDDHSINEHEDVIDSEVMDHDGDDNNDTTSNNAVENSDSGMGNTKDEYIFDGSKEDNLNKNPEFDIDTEDYHLEDHEESSHPSYQQQQQQQQHANSNNSNSHQSAAPFSSTGQGGFPYVDASSHVAKEGNLQLHPLVKEQLKYCAYILRSLKRNKYSTPFLLPVDPISLEIPDYFEVIKHPMDFGTIETRLNNDYYSNPEDFISDIRLVLSNCFAYNNPDSSVYNNGKNVEKAFDNMLKRMPKELPHSSGSNQSKISSPNSSHHYLEDLAHPGGGADKTKRLSYGGVNNSKKRKDSLSSPGAGDLYSSLGSKKKEESLKSPPSKKSYHPGSNASGGSQSFSGAANNRRKGEKTTFSKYSSNDDLKYCDLVYKEITKKQNYGIVWPFLHPVDPVALGIPDYYTIIKNPMDLSTIKKKLDNRDYFTGEEFESDFRLMFKNCYIYNSPDSDVVKFCQSLENIFNDKWNQRPSLTHPSLPSYSQNANSGGGHQHNNHNNNSTSHFYNNNNANNKSFEDSDDEKISKLTTKLMEIQEELSHLIKKKSKKKGSNSNSNNNNNNNNNNGNGNGNKSTSSSSHSNQGSKSLFSPTPNTGSNGGSNASNGNGNNNNSNFQTPSKKSNKGASSSSKDNTGSTSAARSRGGSRKKTPEVFKEMSFEEKKQLCLDINDLPQDKQSKIVEIIHENIPQARDNIRETDEIELDIGSLDDKVLYALSKYVKQCKSSGSGGAEPGASNGGSSSGTNSNVSTPPSSSSSSSKNKNNKSTSNNNNNSNKSSSSSLNKRNSLGLHSANKPSHSGGGGNNSRPAHNMSSSEDSGVSGDESS